MDAYRCRVEGCNDVVKVVSRQLCGMHYRRWQLGKDLDAPKQERVTNKGRLCLVVECGDPADTKGLYTAPIRSTPSIAGCVTDHVTVK